MNRPISFLSILGVAVTLSQIASGAIFEVLPVPGDGVYFLSADSSEFLESEISVGCISESGELLWKEPIGIRRSDAGGGVLCSSLDDGILTAVSCGGGYTDILILKCSNSGEILNRDTIAFVCYDTPSDLFAFNNGYILLWDSWSTERGLHLASIDSSGNVIETVFATGTIQPAASSVSSNSTSFVVAVAPLLMEGNTPLKAYTGIGDNIWSHRLPRTEEGYADFVVDISYLDSGEQVALWSTLATCNDVNLSDLTVLSPDGEMIELIRAPLQDYSDASFVSLLGGQEIILTGRSSEESSYWIARTDIHGNPLQQLSVNSDLLPIELSLARDQGFVVSCSRSDSTERTVLQRVNQSGEIMWEYSTDTP